MVEYNRSSYLTAHDPDNEDESRKKQIEVPFVRIWGSSSHFPEYDEAAEVSSNGFVNFRVSTPSAHIRIKIVIGVAEDANSNGFPFTDLWRVYLRGGSDEVYGPQIGSVKTVPFAYEAESAAENLRGVFSWSTNNEAISVPVAPAVNNGTQVQALFLRKISGSTLKMVVTWEAPEDMDPDRWRELRTRCSAGILSSGPESMFGSGIPLVGA
jgi:hypothetical protein